MPLSEAAMHYGQAMCGPGDQQCAARVGEAWQNDIDARFGVLSSQPPTVVKLDLIGTHGRKIGSLTSIDKQVLLCFDNPDNSRLCGPVGMGNEAFETAQNMLSLQGITTRQA